jgi:lactose/L-arabinose transport system substrate-binding protein
MTRISARLPRFVALAGVSLLSVTAATAGDVSVWMWDPNFNGNAMRLAAERYEAINPEANIIIDDSSLQDDIRLRLQTQLLAGTTEGLPDIVLIQDDVAQKYLQAFPGAFEPLSDVIDMSAFAEYKVAAATLDGVSYSVPFDSGVTGYFYRTDYFEEAGYTAEDLENITWDRLIEIGVDVKEQTGHNLLDIDFAETGLISAMMQSTGEWYFNEDGSLNILENAALRKALETYAAFFAADIVQPVSDWADYTGSFTSGRTASVPVGVWMTGTIKANADQSGLWGVAPIPRMDYEGSINASNWGGSSWFVLSSAPNKEEAIDFLNQIWAQDVEFYQQILVNQGAVGSLLAAREGEAYQSSDEFFGGAPVWQRFSQWLSEVPPIDYGLFSDEVRTAVEVQLPTIAQGGDIDAALEAINAQAQQQTQ